MQDRNIRISLSKWWQTRTHVGGHIVSDTDVSLFARARNIVADTKNCSGFFILCPQLLFPRLLAQGNIMSNKVSTLATAFRT